VVALFGLLTFVAKFNFLLADQWWDSQREVRIKVFSVGEEATFSQNVMGGTSEPVNVTIDSPAFGRKIQAGLHNGKSMYAVAEVEVYGLPVQGNLEAIIRIKGSKTYLGWLLEGQD